MGRERGIGISNKSKTRRVKGETKTDVGQNCLLNLYKICVWVEHIGSCSAHYDNCVFQTVTQGYNSYA